MFRLIDFVILSYHVYLEFESMNLQNLSREGEITLLVISHVYPLSGDRFAKWWSR